MKDGIKNIIYFWSVIWNWRWWDYSYTLDVFTRALDRMADNFEDKGMEVDESRLPKVKDMRELSEILKRISNDDYDYSSVLNDLSDKEFEDYFKRIDDQQEDDIKRISELIKNIKTWWD